MSISGMPQAGESDEWESLSVTEVVRRVEGLEKENAALSKEVVLAKIVRPSRTRICDGLGFPGLELNEMGNSAGAQVISRPGAQVPVWMIRTDEALARFAGGPLPAEAE